MNQDIDLRSDTVTRPTPAMRDAMARAEVGDDQYGEDPATNALQEQVATLLGKDAALWLPSGTMANQVALRVLTRPGDDVIVGREAHAVWHEAGAGAANAGVHFSEVGDDGLISAAQLRAAIKPQGHALYPPTTLLQIENTHNRAGGVVWPQDLVNELCGIAQAANMRCFLDGARLWNAAVASGASPAELARPFDLVAVALSEGSGGTGRFAARRLECAHPGREPTAPHAWRRDAADWHLRGRRPVRAAAPPAAPGRGPSARAPHRRDPGRIAAHPDRPDARRRRTSSCSACARVRATRPRWSRVPARWA